MSPNLTNVLIGKGNFDLDTDVRRGEMITCTGRTPCEGGRETGVQPSDTKDFEQRAEARKGQGRLLLP